MNHKHNGFSPLLRMNDKANDNFSKRVADVTKLLALPKKMGLRLWKGSLSRKIVFF